MARRTAEGLILIAGRPGSPVGGEKLQPGIRHQSRQQAAEFWPDVRVARSRQHPGTGRGVDAVLTDEAHGGTRMRCSEGGGDAPLFLGLTIEVAVLRVLRPALVDMPADMRLVDRHEGREAGTGGEVAPAVAEDPVTGPGRLEFADDRGRRCATVWTGEAPKGLPQQLVLVRRERHKRLSLSLGCGRQHQPAGRGREGGFPGDRLPETRAATWSR